MYAFGSGRCGWRVGAWMRELGLGFTGDRGSVGHVGIESLYLIIFSVFVKNNFDGNFNLCRQYKQDIHFYMFSLYKIKQTFILLLIITQSYNIMMNYLIIRCVTFSLVLSSIYSKYLTYKQRSILKYDSFDKMILFCLLFYIRCNNC